MIKQHISALTRAMFGVGIVRRKDHVSSQEQKLLKRKADIKRSRKNLHRYQDTHWAANEYNPVGNFADNRRVHPTLAN